eukprot:204032-Rhodomonas_salina.1
MAYSTCIRQYRTWRSTRVWQYRTLRRTCVCQYRTWGRRVEGAYAAPSVSQKSVSLSVSAPPPYPFSVPHIA